MQIYVNIEILIFKCIFLLYVRTWKCEFLTTKLAIFKRFPFKNYCSLSILTLELASNAISLGILYIIIMNLKYHKMQFAKWRLTDYYYEKMSDITRDTLVCQQNSWLIKNQVFLHKLQTIWDIFCSSFDFFYYWLDVIKGFKWVSVWKYRLSINNEQHTR